MTNFNSSYGTGADMMGWLHTNALLFSLLALWSLFWTALALWHSGRKGQYWWFLAFLVIHTAGILEIIYLFGVLKLKSSQLFKK